MDKTDLYLNPTPIKKEEVYLDSVPIDKEIVNLDSAPVDVRTDFGKGIYYKTCDGKDVATMEEVMLYNQMYYERMKIQSQEQKEIHR